MWNETKNEGIELNQSKKIEIEHPKNPTYPASTNENQSNQSNRMKKEGIELKKQIPTSLNVSVVPKIPLKIQYCSLFALP